MKKEDKKLLYFGGFAGFIASLCCIGPVILVLLGLTGVSTALIIGKYWWLFTSIAVILFFVVVVLFLKKKDCCSPRGIKEQWKIILISFVIFAALLILLKYWIAPFIATIAYR